MPIRFSCPACGHSYEVPDAQAGMQGTCRQCHTRIAIPAVMTPSAAAPVMVSYAQTAEADPVIERMKRGRNLVVIALLLAGAFLIPFAKPAGKSIEWVLVPDTATTLQQFLVFFPIAAAGAVFILAFIPPVRFRGLLLLAIALAPAVVLYNDTGFRQSAEDAFRARAPGDTEPQGWLLLAGVCLLFVTSRSRFWRPLWGLLYLPALAGAVMVAGSLFIPVDRGGEKQYVLPSLLEMANKAIQPEAAMAGTLVAAFSLMLLAAALAALSLPTRVAPLTRGLNKWSARNIVLSLLVLIGMFVYLTWVPVIEAAKQLDKASKLSPTEASQVKDAMVAMVSMAAAQSGKLFFWLLGPLFLLVAGIVEIIIGAPARVDKGLVSAPPTFSPPPGNWTPPMVQ